MFYIIITFIVAVEIIFAKKTRIFLKRSYKYFSNTADFFPTSTFNFFFLMRNVVQIAYLTVEA